VYYFEHANISKFVKYTIMNSDSFHYESIKSFML